MTFCWRMRIKTYCHMGWILILDQFDQGVCKPKLGIGISTLAGDAGVADKRIISTEYEGKCIEEE